MEPNGQPPSVQIGTGPGGSTIYLVSMPPEALPSVRARDLDHAWHAARRGALDHRWGTLRGFRFTRPAGDNPNGDNPDGDSTDLMLADPDACCWVAAVDLSFGLGSPHGLSVCLRLLALIDLLARADWARQLVRWDRDGATLHAGLLRAAAGQPLTAYGRFDDTAFRIRLSGFVAGVGPESAPPAPRLTGVSA